MADVVERTKARSLTLRVPEAQAQLLDAIAEADGVSISEEIRQALVCLFESKRQDETFRARLLESIAHQQELLEEAKKFAQTSK